ncbi:MAG: UDP-N-acetylmuramate dehydrogenase [Bacteroidetes bacterium]|nr:MAG: UDP-N-acetylmuramate dehydrogenase [Bacteroidota bacterium]
MLLQENYPLRKLNTFGMNASARWFTEANSMEDLHELFGDSRTEQRHAMILGGGSNILFTKNYDGLVIKNNLLGIEKIREDDQHYYIKSGAGEVWHAFVLHCIANNYAGIENLSLIPGSVGAGPMQNIGAYGVELKDVFHELEAFHTGEKTIRKFSHADCRFGYRESVFKRELKDQYVITSVTFRLSKTPKLNTSYGAIEKELEQMGVTEPGIASVSRAVIHIRSSKLPDPAQIGNAGSFFKNPVIGAAEHERLKKEFPEIVSYKNSDTDFKLAAGWLIEQCGWKGFRQGDAGVHKDQALVLVNYGNAKGEEIYALSQRVLDSVKAKFGVLLEREVNIV